jgi:hypothetical protein
MYFVMPDLIRHPVFPFLDSSAYPGPDPGFAEMTKPQQAVGNALKEIQNFLERRHP